MSIPDGSLGSSLESSLMEIEIGSLLRVNPGDRVFVVDSIFRDYKNGQIVIRVHHEIDKNHSVHIVKIGSKWYSEFQREYEIVFERRPEDFDEKREFRLIDLVRKHRDKSWSWISRNPNITTEDIEEDLFRNDPLQWDWEEISMNPNITPEFIESHLYDSR